MTVITKIIPFFRDPCARSVQTVCTWKRRRKSDGRGSRKSVAVLSVGLQSRFFPVPVLRHVVAPASKAGFDVDYFVSLSPSHSTFNGSDHGAYWYRPNPNPRFENFSAATWEHYLTRYARRAGARRSAVLLRSRDVDIRLQRMRGRRYFHPNRVTALRALHRFLHVELLWNWTMEQGFGGYDLVVLLREDLYFVDDVDLTRFADPGVVYSTEFGALCSRAQPEFHNTINDRAIIFGGEAAGQMINLYTEFFFNPSRALHRVRCTEDYVQAVARAKGIPWSIIPKNWLPYWAAVHMGSKAAVNSGSGRPVLCFRGTARRELGDPSDHCVPAAVLRRAAASEPEATLQPGPRGVPEPVIPFCNDLDLM